MLIDTHTHIYAAAFDEDRDEAIKRAIAAGVLKLVLPAIDSKTTAIMHEVKRNYPENVFLMMGLHPTHVGLNVEQELAHVKEQLEAHSYVAVGEIGMDLYWDKTYIEQQKLAFIEQCAWAKERNLPIVIHVRDSWEELFEIMDKVNDDELRGVFHCFTGGQTEAVRALEYGGFLLGIGGVSTYKNGGLDKVIPGVGLENLVLETDSPYLSPVPCRGKRNESSCVRHVADRVAEILNLTTEEVAQVTTENAVNLFKI